MDTSVVIPDREGRSSVTGRRQFFDDKQWQPEPVKEVTDVLGALQAIYEVQAALLQEIRALRLGMTENGTCSEINPRDIPLTLDAAT